MSKDQTYFKKGREFYTASNRPVWRQRHRELPDPRTGEPRGDLRDDPAVVNTLKQLQDMEERTRPSSNVSPSDKDLNAFRALHTGARLLRYIAGWAIDHQRGTAENGLCFVPNAPMKTRTNPEYTQRRAEVDKHDHEKLGSARHSLTPVQARLFVRNVLLPMIYELDLPHEIIEALEALDFGQILPIVEKVRTRRTGLTVLRAKLSALAYIDYEYAKGTLKNRSTNVVVETFAASRDVIKDWAVELRGALGNLEVASALNRAHSCGSNYLEAKAGRDPGIDPQLFENWYGLPALQRAAVTYKARSKKAKK
jgi:hypothetical protein